jgi:hypothetical protein
MMITLEGNDTRMMFWGKYNCPMAVYLYEYTTMSGEGEYSGTVDSPTGWFARAGRWILREDDRGFVSAAKYDDYQDSQTEYDYLVSEYDKWENEDD